jgi:hypothetical protein
MWNGYVSLLTNYRSEVHVWPAKEIPPRPVVPSRAASRNASTESGPLSRAENDYAVWLFNQFKALIPDSNNFEEKRIQAMNVKDKYSLLKDIQADRFYDLIGEVIRIYNKAGVVTMYISDYTAHKLFYNNVFGGANDHPSIRDGDEYGYIKSNPEAVNDWPGPYGKLSIQLTVYDGSAIFIAEKVKIHNWVLLKNVQIKMGSHGGFIEGFLRGDKQCDGKIQVHIISLSEGAEMNDRWKEAVRRKLGYWQKFKKQRQELEDSTNSNGKRKLDTEGTQKQNSKNRRKKKRTAAEQKVAALEQNHVKKLDLNVNGIANSYF